MEKLDLNIIAGEFDMINSECHLFFNTETYEFDYYSDYMDDDDIDINKFDDDDWIAAPSQQDLNEYRIMEDFICTVSDPRKNELLSTAIEDKGAFRRFKDTLHRVELTDE